MSQDTSSIEADLRNLRAPALDEALLARLEACVADTWTQLTPEEIDFENRLRAIAPARISPALMDSLESIVSGVSFPSGENIVPFSTATPHHNRRWWAAAAAVALIGAMTALMTPGDRGAALAPVAHQPTTRGVTHPAPASDAFVPAGFSRDLREARDEGIVWQSNNEAHRVLKVVYMERVTMKAPDGRVYEVERPRVEYIHMPEQSD